MATYTAAVIATTGGRPPLAVTRARLKCEAPCEVSFVLEIEVAELDWELAEQLERRTIDAGCIAVHPGRRRRWLRPREPSLRIDADRDEVPVLSDEADWDEPAFTLDERGRDLLAQTISVLDEALTTSWSLRAYWTGDPLLQEPKVTARDLSKLIRDSAMDRETRYRVRR